MREGSDVTFERALEQAYDDEVSRLFRELCGKAASGGKLDDALKVFDEGVVVATKAAQDAVKRRRESVGDMRRAS
jgi:hypothetical protein